MNPTDQKLFQLFSDKTLSEGCLLNTDHGEIKWDGYFLVGDDSLYRESRNGNEPYLFSKTFEILGHEPRLEDVFRVANEKGFGYLTDRWIIEFQYPKSDTEFIRIPYNPILSLIKQSEETKLAIINLFTND